jgi:LPXTG-motif cell wall-anchored protein
VLAGATGVISGTSIGVTVPYETDVSSLTPTITHTGASVSPIDVQNFTSQVTYTVTAEDSTTKSYTVTVTVGPAPLPSDKDITSFTLAGVTGIIDGTSIGVTVPYGTNLSLLTPAITHTGVGISPTDAQDFTTQVTYTVTAEDATTKSYTVTVTIAPPPSPSDKDITSFTLAGVTGIITGTSIGVTVPYGTSITALIPIITHTGVGISPTGTQDFTSQVTYTVTAEDGTTKDYTATVLVDTSIPLILAPATWTGTGVAVARIDAPYSDFVRLMLNGVEVSTSNYTVSEGSTVITFNEAYLKTLADGDYLFTAVFTNGEANVPLTVSTHPSGGTGSNDGGNQSAAPATGDTGSLALAVLAGLLLITGTVFLIRRHRLRRLF